MSCSSLLLAVMFFHYYPKPKPVNLAYQPHPILGVASAAATIKLEPTPTPTPTPQPTIPMHAGKELRVPILTYHYIGNNPNPADTARDNLSVPPDKFEDQMKYIATNGYTTIDFDTLYAALKGKTTLPAKPVILTFDDGYIDFFVNAFPILRRLNLHATAFIPTGLMDQGYYLHWDQIKQMNATGLISFEAHSVTHPNLVSLSLDKERSEIVESKKTLEGKLGKPVNFMAYPYGISNAMTWDLVKQAGYVGAIGTWTGTTISEGVLFDIPREKIAGNFSIQTFAKKL